MVNARKVGDISIDELKDVIKETVYEIIDPDYGSDVSTAVKKLLMESLQSKERIPVDDAAGKLGLKW